MLSQLQSAVSSGPHDENGPPQSDPRFPRPPLPMTSLGDDRQADSHELKRSSAPLSPHRDHHTGTPHSNPLVPIQPSNDIQKQDTVSTSPATQPSPIQSVVPEPATTSTGAVMSSSPAPDADTSGPARRISEAGHTGQHHHGDFELRASPREQSPEQTHRNGQRTFQLHTLLKDAEPEVLEAGVQQGLKLLRNLKSLLTARAPEYQDSLQWVEQIGT